MAGLHGENYLETDRPTQDIVRFPKDAVRICLGWFFPDNNPDENAIYWDYYFDRYGYVFLTLEEAGFEEELCKVDFGVK